MSASNSTGSKPKGVTGYIGIFVGILGTAAAIAGNASAIKKSWGDFFGAAPPLAVKLTLKDVRLTPSKVEISFTSPFAGKLNYFKVRSTMPPAAELRGKTVIDLDALQAGDALNHAKFASPLLEDVLKGTAGPAGNIADQVILISKNPAIYAPSVWVLNATIGKDSVPEVSNCKMKIRGSNGDIYTTNNSVSLEPGVWSNFFKFDIIMPQPEASVKLSAILYCQDKSQTVGADAAEVAL